MNTLSSPAGYRLIDPDPVQGEPAYDLAIPLREVPRSELGADPAAGARELCELVAGPHGVDPEAVWQWAFVERVSTGLLCARLGHDEWARPLLAVADALAPSAGFDRL
jgi:streptomycin 6-kinase